jgi:hypothetical protein
MFPNEARLRIWRTECLYTTIDIEFIDILENGEKPTIIGEF